jgi:hypothetical protein
MLLLPYVDDDDEDDEDDENDEDDEDDMDEEEYAGRLKSGALRNRFACCANLSSCRSSARRWPLRLMVAVRASFDLANLTMYAMNSSWLAF